MPATIAGNPALPPRPAATPPLDLPRLVMRRAGVVSLLVLALRAMQAAHPLRHLSRRAHARHGTLLLGPPPAVG